MNALKQFLTVSALALGVARLGEAQTAAPAAPTDGEIKKVDAERGKVTIGHDQARRD